MPDYDYGIRSLSKDVVLITLKDSLDNVVPSELARSDTQTSRISLTYAAYPADRRYVLTAQFGCHLVTKGEDLWRTDCDARPGSSGGPVFIEGENGPRLAAIMVGAGPSGSVAVPIASWVDDIAEARNCP
jgi:V8-like Glu-specific endopeptidase